MSSRRRPKSAAAKTGAPKTGARANPRANPRARPAPRRRAQPPRDFWGAEHPDRTEHPEPPEDLTPAPIRPTDDPTALIHSLGPPPLPNSLAARHYFDAIYERSAALAVALATSAGLIDPSEPD
jgi:hypothetical protein